MPKINRRTTPPANFRSPATDLFASMILTGSGSEVVPFWRRRSLALWHAQNGSKSPHHQPAWSHAHANASLLERVSKAVHRSAAIRTSSRSDRLRVHNPRDDATMLSSPNRPNWPMLPSRSGAVVLADVLDDDLGVGVVDRRAERLDHLVDFRGPSRVVEVDRVHRDV